MCRRDSYDIAYMRSIPNMIVASPMNEEELRNLMSVSYTHLDVYKRQMQADLNLMKKDEYLKLGNFKTLNYFE